jgi:hypothetical protein
MAATADAELPLRADALSSIFLPATLPLLFLSSNSGYPHVFKFRGFNLLYRTLFNLPQFVFNLQIRGLSVAYVCKLLVVFLRVLHVLLNWRTPT